MHFKLFFTGPTCTFITIAILTNKGEGITIADSFALVGTTRNFTEAERECRGRGYDGLGVVSSPEEYNHVILASQQLRTQWGLWVGLRYDLGLQKLQWDDGTDPSPNMPWVKGSAAPSEAVACARLFVAGAMGMLECHRQRFYICGNR
ncbi:hypothetical protein EGW08_017047, partial [Elysia chlorotica]